MHDLGHEEDLKLPPFIVKEAKKNPKKRVPTGRRDDVFGCKENSKRFPPRFTIPA